VRPALARFLAEDEPGLLSDVERELSIRVVVVADETLPPARYEIER
jgi:hypothetical protein